MRQVVANLIRIYQRTISPDHGWRSASRTVPTCKFYPTCSEYARQAVLKQGAIRGLWSSAGRVLRCHPWARGGFDPIT